MRQPIRAIAFDAYGTLFDVYCMSELAEEMFPGRGGALTSLWREKQIDYTRIRTLCGQYKSFWDVTRDALGYAAAALEIDLNEQQRQQLMNQYACLTPYPGTIEALQALRGLGLPLAILSNGTPAMLDIAVKYCGMGGLFTHVLSADKVRKFKTAPEVYQLGAEALALPAAEILFVSANSWDACAATWFGYTTFWINRRQEPVEALGIAPSGSGRSLADVVDFVQGAH